jgi:hypothetical protein
VKNEVLDLVFPYYLLLSEKLNLESVVLKIRHLDYSFRILIASILHAIIIGFEVGVVFSCIATVTGIHTV